VAAPSGARETRTGLAGARGADPTAMQVVNVAADAGLSPQPARPVTRAQSHRPTVVRRYVNRSRVSWSFRRDLVETGVVCSIRPASEQAGEQLTIRSSADPEMMREIKSPFAWRT
jgi:hypothetical protein